MIRCCKDCEKRAVGCHADCPAYNGEKAKMDEDNRRERLRLSDGRAIRKNRRRI